MKWQKGIQTVFRNPHKAYEYLKSYYTPAALLDNVSLALTSRFPIGTHVLHKEWDLLIILDTCRYDAMQAVSDEYDFIDCVEKFYSRGGSSPDWIAHTFAKTFEKELEETVYVTANPHAETVLQDREYIPNKHSLAAKRFYKYGDWNTVRPEKLKRFEQVWKYDSGHSGEPEVESYTPPRFITDRAIEISRNEDFDRMILHYMQPHYPYISNAIEESRGLRSYEKNPKAVKKDGYHRVYSSYIDELRHVLDEIEILLENVDADKVAISADHGDAFGKYCVYGHNPGRIHPGVRYVPWVETSAVDKGTHTPDFDYKMSSDGIEKHLQALGYRT